MSCKQSPPKIFAPRPISNVLKSKAKTPIIKYKSGNVIREDDDSQEVSFSSIDLDKWMQTALEYIDELLMPKYVSWAEILRKNINHVPVPPNYVPLAATLREKQKLGTPPYRWGNALQELLDSKEHLADKLRTAMIPLYEEETADTKQLGDIQEAFYQRMLGAMSQFYSVKAAIQFKAEIKAATKQQTHTYEASRVFGDTRSVLLNVNEDGQYVELENCTHEDLGQVHVPILLRAFPAMPTLVNQEVIPVKKTQPGGDNPLTEVTRWSYAFEYSMPDHCQQDEIHGTVSFNIGDSSSIDESMGLTAAETKRDLFDNLAQFVQVYPDVRDDLKYNLVNINAGMVDPDRLVKAQTALETAAVMINWLADSVVPFTTENEKLPAASAAEDVASINFTISETGVQKGIVLDALKVTVELTEDLPPRVGKPRVEIDGYSCVLEQKKQPKTKTLKSKTPSYTFFYKDSDGNYLSYSIARKIPGRKFVLPDMDILERQDAQTEIYITRNDNLDPEKKIASPFVYISSKASFANTLVPLICNNDEINLAKIFVNEIPVPRTLESSLRLFYQALFANACTNDVTLQLGLYYEYSINPDIDNIRLTFFLMPPTKIVIRAGGSDAPLTEFITNQVNAWETWFNAHNPETRGGRLVFDLTVYSSLMARPMPLLRMQRLYLPLTDMNGSDNVVGKVNY